MATANIKVTLLCPIEKVWQKMTDLKDFAWRSDLQDIIIVDSHHFVEISKDGLKTDFRLTEFKKHEVWASEIENEHIKGNWTCKFYSHGANTSLDCTVNVIAKNMLFKAFVGPHLRKLQKRYFQDLKKELNCEEASWVPKL